VPWRWSKLSFSRRPLDGQEIGRAIDGAWELAATLDPITRRTADVMRLDSCSIYLLDHNRNSLVLRRILIAYDYAVTRLGLRTILQQLGHPVVGMAEDGTAARRLACETRPYRAILELKLPAWMTSARLPGAVRYRRSQRYPYRLSANS
jgi:hypothetical protein